MCVEMQQPQLLYYIIIQHNHVGFCISGIHLDWLEKWLRYLALFGGLPTGVGGDWAGLGCQGTGPRPVGGTQLEAPPSPRGRWLQWKSVEPPDSHSTAV